MFKYNQISNIECDVFIIKGEFIKIVSIIDQFT